MSSVDALYNWWYQGWGIGGWLIFLLLALGAIVYVLFDSQSRGVSATGWKLAAILAALLLLPTIFYKFSDAASREAMVASGVHETFFFLGLLGGIVPIASAIGYAINFAGLLPAPPSAEQPVAEPPPVEEPPAPAEKSARPLAPAWLIEIDTDRSHQLFRGDSRIGRGKQNDLVLADKAVSREHILIREENERFTLYDRGSKTGTLVNDRRVEYPVLLEHDDLIVIGDTRLRFVIGR
jgi:hypothetical protein